MARSELQLLPEFTAELEEIRAHGINKELLYKILQKHLPNADYNKILYKRYMAIQDGVPILSRKERYKDENKKKNTINNKVNNDFFSEIVDFKVGYFAGEPISYTYSETDEAEEVTGGENAVDEANKVLTDFITRNNMFGVDMETTKNASIYGYSGRLFYIDKEGIERVMPVHGYETIILSSTDISEPEFAIRYYRSLDIDGAEVWTADFYDDKTITTFRGSSLLALEEIETKAHLFDYCPLQGIANNKEHIGDAEKVLALIDDYDKVLSDNSNELESFVHAMLLVTILGNPEKIAESLEEANSSGIMHITPTGTTQVNEPVKWLTKQINDAFTEHHLERLEDNIYRFSKTPNMGDESFGSASGVSLKFKLHGLETKCATFEASVMNSAQHMWRVLCSAWNKKGKTLDPLQICMEFRRNFPLDRLSEAQTAQAQIAAGLPKRWVFSQIAGIDDIEYIMQLLEEEKGDITSLYPDIPVVNDDTDDSAEGNKATNSQLNNANTGKEKLNLLNGAQIQALTGIVSSYKDGVLSRNAAITMATSALGISRDNAEAIIEEKAGK